MVLADTHMPRKGRRLDPLVFNELERADLILHLGDITRPEILTELGQFAAIRAVQGNNDSSELRERLPLKDQFVIGPHAITMIHGHVGGRTAREAASRVNGSGIVLFGHSHRPECRKLNGILYFNPGSPTDRRWGPYRSFGILDIDDDVEATIVPLPDH